MAYLLAYNFQRPLKGLKYMSPYDKMIEIYEDKAELFRFDPTQKIVGLNNLCLGEFCGHLAFSYVIRFQSHKNPVTGTVLIRLP